MNSINILAIMPSGIKKWAKPFLDAVLGTLKQISGTPFQKQFGMVSSDMTDDELEQIKDKIIRADIFIFVLSPDYVLFEQTRGLLQLVKAREIIVKAEHKIVFSILRETCKIPPYFLQKPLYDFIGESFNTPSFKNKYVKLIKDVVSATKASDNLNKTKTQKIQFETQQEEATAIPISEEPASAPTQSMIQNQMPDVAQISPMLEEQKITEAPIAADELFNQTPAQTDYAELQKVEETDEEFEPVDFLEPFNNQAPAMADDIPEAPQFEESSQQKHEYFSAPSASEPEEKPEEIPADIEDAEEFEEKIDSDSQQVEEPVMKSAKTFEKPHFVTPATSHHPEEKTSDKPYESEIEEEPKFEDLSKISEDTNLTDNADEPEEEFTLEETSVTDYELLDEKPDIDFETDESETATSSDFLDNEIMDDVTIIDISDELETSSLDDINFDDFDMDATEDERQQKEEEKTLQNADSTVNDESILEQNDKTSEKINSDLETDLEDDIVLESLDAPESEDVIVELKQSNELSQNNDWDSFVEEESKVFETEKQSTHIEPEIKVDEHEAEEEEELEPWTGSASTYEDPDIKKKIDTDSFDKKKVDTKKSKKATSAHIKNSVKTNSKKNRSKRRKRILKTDADIISGEVQNDGVDVLEELGIDIDNIPDTPEPKITKKSDTASIEELLKQEELSMEDDLSFDNELVLEDAEDESIEDESVGKEFGMAQIKLADDTAKSKKAADKDIIDELEIGVDVKKMKIPKGNCTLFMNKVPENRKDEAIKLIQEITNMDVSEIEKLLARIVVPVLKDVFVEQAEKALDKLKRSGFNGRIRKT